MKKISYKNVLYIMKAHKKYKLKSKYTRNKNEPDDILLKIREMNATLDKLILDRIKDQEERKKREEREMIERKAAEEAWKKETRKINKLIGQYSISYGREAEYMFYRSLEKTRICANIQFDRIFLHAKPRKDGREYDILLINGEYMGIVEIKRTASMPDLIKLVEEQAVDIKRDMPEHKDKKVICILAAYTCIDEIVTKAKELGVCVLLKDGVRVKEIMDEIKFY